MKAGSVIAATLLLFCSSVALLPRSASAALSAPLAAYSFDRMSDVNVFDESSNGNDCIVNDPLNVLLSTGHTNQALENQSTGRWAHCTNNNLKPTSAITVMAWVNLAAGGFNNVPLAMPRNGSSDSWAIYSGNGAFNYAAFLQTTSSSHQINTSVAVNTGVWDHVALTYDGATMKFYVNGTLEGSQAITGNIDYGGNTNPLNIFTDATAQDWQGKIDDLRLYGSALSQAEVQTLMNSPVPNFHTNTNGRSLIMGSSQPSATGVTYSAGFKVDQSYSLRTVLMDFCSNSPREGQSCTAPGGFTVSGSPTISNFKINGAAPGGTWTGSSQNSGRTLVVTGSAGVDVVPGDIVTFDVTTVTNPSAIGSFFGRMFTYNFASPSYSATSTDNFKESGGVALSTANGIGFIFQVPESLQFCVYKTTCGDAPNVALGHGPQTILDPSQVDTDTAKFSVSTNAVNGITVIGSSTPLAIPSHIFAGISPNYTPLSLPAGTEAWGLRVDPAFGALAAEFNLWDPGSAGLLSYANCLYTNEISYTGGCPITRQDTAGPVNNEELTITFGATTSPTTPSGEYKSKMILVAVGSF